MEWIRPAVLGALLVLAGCAAPRPGAPPGSAAPEPAAVEGDWLRLSPDGAPAWPRERAWIAALGAGRAPVIVGEAPPPLDPDPQVLARHLQVRADTLIVTAVFDAVEPGGDAFALEWGVAGRRTARGLAFGPDGAVELDGDALRVRVGGLDAGGFATAPPVVPEPWRGVWIYYSVDPAGAAAGGAIEIDAEGRARDLGDASRAFSLRIVGPHALWANARPAPTAVPSPHVRTIAPDEPWPFSVEPFELDGDRAVIGEGRGALQMERYRGRVEDLM